MNNISGYLQGLNDQILKSGDQRTTDWAFVKDPKPVIVLMIVHVLVSAFGTKLISKPFRMGMDLFVKTYNAILILLSAYLFKEFLIVSYKGNYNYICEPVHKLPYGLPLRMAEACWLFYISKIVEMFDTVLIVLRKKTHNLTFLHVYHHCSMVFFQWMAIKYVPGGKSFFHSMINAFVHVVMYFYYFLASFGPTMRRHLWWKKYITQLQMFQFLVVICQTLMSMWKPCSFPYFYNYLVLGNCSILLMLFYNFYRKAYKYSHIYMPTPISIQHHDYVEVLQKEKFGKKV